MKQSDFDSFHTLLADCLSMWSSSPSAGVTAIWFRALAQHSLSDLSAAFSAHMRDPANGKFEPKPAHIIEQIERAARADGRPGAEEAWAISLGAKTEDETVVWTRECSQAWAAAKPVMGEGDEVGARMAFKETYARLVAEARARREPASWEVSEGFDKDRRRIAIAGAVEAGRLPAGQYVALEHTSALLLGSDLKAAIGIPVDVREKLADLRAMFANPPTGLSEADEERERTAALKRQQVEKVEQFLARGVA